jgi:hypothetical protein
MHQYYRSVLVFKTKCTASLYISGPVSTTSARLFPASAFHRNCTGFCSLHNVAFVNCWSVTQRLDAFACVAMIYYSFLQLHCFCVMITRMLAPVDISLQIISFCFLFLLLLLLPNSSSLPSFFPFLFSLFFILLRFPVLVRFQLKSSQPFSGSGDKF